MILVALLIGLMAMAPRTWRRWREERHRRNLAVQLCGSLQSLVQTLRSGISVTLALQYLVRDSAEPLKSHWHWLVQSLQVGKSFPQTLEELSVRVPIKEMRWFVAAVQITQRTGGSLADVLETLATTLQEQQMLREKISALTAQGKASGILMSAMPFLILSALFLIAPEMVTPLFTTWMGQAMLASVILLVAVGGFVIQQIVTIPIDS